MTSSSSDFFGFGIFAGSRRGARRAVFILKKTEKEEAANKKVHSRKMTSCFKICRAVHEKSDLKRIFNLLQTDCCISEQSCFSEAVHKVLRQSEPQWIWVEPRETSHKDQTELLKLLKRIPFAEREAFVEMLIQQSRENRLFYMGDEVCVTLLRSIQNKKIN